MGRQGRWEGKEEEERGRRMERRWRGSKVEGKTERRKRRRIRERGEEKEG